MQASVFLWDLKTVVGDSKSLIFWEKDEHIEKNISYGVRMVFVYVAIRVKDRILQKLELGNLKGEINGKNNSLQ